MATSNRKAESPKAKQPQVDWNSMLNQFSAGGGIVLFLKGKVRCRLMPFENPNEIFIPVDSVYQGNVRTKYLVKIWQIDAEEGQPRIRGLLLSKRDIRGILQLQVEGWDLFDPETGHAIALIKSGSGPSTSVNVSPSPKPVPVPADVLEEAEEVDLTEEAAKFSAIQHRRSEEGDQAEGSTNDADDDDETF